MGSKIGEVFVEIKADASKLKQGLDDVKSGVENTGRKIDSTTSAMSDSFKKVGAFIVEAFAIHKIVDFVKEITLAAAKFEEISSFFKGSAGDMENFRKATKGTVSDMSLMKLSNQASDLGVNLKEQPLLFAMAKRAGEAYGKGTEEGFQRVVMATEGNVKGLQAVGVQKKVYEQTVKDLARAHHGLITELDAETQKEIRMQALIKASGMTMEEATKTAKSHADRIEAVGAKWENLKVTLGKGLTPFFAGVFDALGKTLEKISELGARMAGVLKVAGGEDRKAGYYESVKDESQGAINSDKDFVTEKIRVLNITKGILENNKMNTDATVKELQVYQDQLSVLMNIDSWRKKDKDAKGGKSDDKSGSDLTPEAMAARQQKQQELENKFNAMMLGSQKINLEKQLKNSDDAVALEYAKLDAAGKKKFSLAELQAAERLKVEEKYYADRINLIEQKTNLKKITGSNFEAIKVEKESFEELLKTVTSEKVRTELLSKILAIKKEMYAIDKATTDEINKGNDEKTAYVAKTSPKQPFNPTVEESGFYGKYKAGGGQLSMQAMVALLKAGDVELNKMFEDYKKVQGGAERFANTISSGLVQGIVAGENLGNVFARLVEQIAEAVAQAAIFSSIMSFINPSGGGFFSFFTKALGFGHSGGEFVGTPGGVMKLAAGGSFTVPSGYPNDSFPLMVQTAERVSVYTPEQHSANMRDYSDLLSEVKGTNSRVEALTMATIKNGSKQPPVYLSVDSKILGETVTRKQNQFAQGNVKVSR